MWRLVTVVHKDTLWGKMIRSYTSMRCSVVHTSPVNFFIDYKNRNCDARHERTTSSASVQSRNFPPNKLMYKPYNSVSRFMFSSVNFSFGIQIQSKAWLNCISWTVLANLKYCNFFLVFQTTIDGGCYMWYYQKVATGTRIERLFP